MQAVGDDVFVVQAEAVGTCFFALDHARFAHGGHGPVARLFAEARTFVGRVRPPVTQRHTAEQGVRIGIAAGDGTDVVVEFSIAVEDVALYGFFRRQRRVNEKSAPAEDAKKFERGFGVVGAETAVVFRQGSFGSDGRAF